MKNSSILIVDDKEEVLRSFKLMLRTLITQSSITTLSDPEKVIPAIEANKPDVVLLDLNMPKISGTELLQIIKETHPDIIVIIITANDDLQQAVKCTRLGAYDYFVKPVDHERLSNIINKVLESKSISEELISIQKHMLENNQVDGKAFSKILTSNSIMKNLFKYIEAISNSNRQVLILGETGTGKELFAEAVHKISSQKTGELISVNVAGLDDSTFSDTLFGHRKGAYTGAISNREGLLKKAQGGTIFLDEIGDLEIKSQVKLLRLLQEKSYYPLGSDTLEYSDARIVTATHRNLEELIAEGTFRRDLYYRLQIHTIKIPPLRDRKEDIPLLTKFFVEKASAELSCPLPKVTNDLLKVLKDHPFPGNVRELEIMLYDAVAQTTGDTIELEHLLAKLSSTPVIPPTHSDNSRWSNIEELPTIKDATEQLIEEVLKRTQNNQKDAAKILGLTRQALYKRLSRKRNQEKDNS